jgi:hypothetical protein
MSLDEFETTGIMGDMGVVGGSRTPSLGKMGAGTLQVHSVADQTT